MLAEKVRPLDAPAVPGLGRFPVPPGTEVRRWEGVVRMDAIEGLRQWLTAHSDVYWFGVLTGCFATMFGILAILLIAGEDD